MAVIETHLEGDRLIFMEAPTTDQFSKSELGFRPNPMAAMEKSMDAIGDIGRVIASRVRLDLRGTGVESAEVTFGVKVDSIGLIMVAQESDAAQFTVKLTVRVG